MMTSRNGARMTIGALWTQWGAILVAVGASIGWFIQWRAARRAERRADNELQLKESAEKRAEKQALAVARRDDKRLLLEASTVTRETYESALQAQREHLVVLRQLLDDTSKAAESAASQAAVSARKDAEAEALFEKLIEGLFLRENAAEIERQVERVLGDARRHASAVLGVDDADEVSRDELAGDPRRAVVFQLYSAAKLLGATAVYGTAAQAAVARFAFWRKDAKIVNVAEMVRAFAEHSSAPASPDSVLAAIAQVMERVAPGRFRLVAAETKPGGTGSSA